MERFSLDLEVANSRSSEGEKTKNMGEVNDYLKQIQDRRNKAIGGKMI